MVDLITWVTDVLAVEFTIGTVTLSLGAIMIGFSLITAVFALARRWVGRR